MTPEERARNVISEAYAVGRDKKDSWYLATNLEQRIRDAIREAVAEEKEATRVLREELEYAKAGILSTDSAKRAFRQAVLGERDACGDIASKAYEEYARSAQLSRGSACAEVYIGKASVAIAIEEAIRARP